MGIMLARFAGISAFVGLVMLSSSSRAGTINESYVDFFAQPIDVSSTTVVDGLGYDALWNSDVYRANMGLYTDVDGLPGALITQTGPFAPISGEHDFAVSPSTTLSEGSYWVVGGYNLSGNREDVEENEGPDYVASLPATWTFGNDYYYLYEDIEFYAVTENAVTSSDGTDMVSHNSQLTYGLDYLVWAGTYGGSSPRIVTPEPATFSLLVLGALPLLIGRRRR